MILRFCVIILSALMITSCSPSKKGQPKTNFDNILITDLDGFSRTGQLKIYSADSLSNYIGATDMYISYGVIQVAGTEYHKDAFTYSVDIFEFDNPLGAFGIYARKRQPTDKFIGLGTESFIGDGYVYYFKDRYFMTVNSYGNDLPDLISLNRLAQAIDSLIPGAAAYPQQIMIFPDKRLIEHSQKFWPHGFDYYAVPESCFSADYERYGKTCRLFYALDRPIIEYETFKKLIQQKGRIITHMADVGKNSVYAINEIDGKILLGYSDHVIFGVLDVTNDFWAKALCEAMFENLGKKL
jgi:hypothetical protein